MERGTIELNDRTRELLARVWRDRGRPTLVLERRAVADVVRVVRSPIPNEVLAILVAEGRLPAAIPHLTELVTTYFSSMFGTDWKRAANFDHVMFAQLGSDDDEPSFVGFHRNAPHGLAVWELRKPPAGGVSASLREYLQQRWGDDDCVHLDRKATVEEVATFVPVIDDPPPVPMRRVSHPKFGIGVVLERKDGKVRVAFSGVGEKLLGEKFVTDIE